MTKTQARECLICVYQKIVEDGLILYSLEEVRQALDIAINNLKKDKDSKKIGHWITIDYQRGLYECSECHTRGYVDTEMYKPTWVACPRCGARMENEE